MAGTILNPSSVFTVLVSAQFEETSAIVRGLRSNLVEPAGFNNITSPEDITRSGFSADTPAIVSRPFQIQLENLLQLSKSLLGFDDSLGQLDLQTQATINLLDSALIDSPPPIDNVAGAILQLESFLAIVEARNGTTDDDTEADEDSEESDVTEEDEDDTTVTSRFSDFTTAFSEQTAFGTTFSAVATDDTLNTLFDRRVALSGGATVTLSDLVERSGTGTATHYAIDLRGELGGSGAATLLDETMTAVADNIVITAAELSTFSVQAANGTGALDYISIIELSDPGGDGTFDGRGSMHTIALTNDLEVQDQSGNLTEGDTVEDIREFTFGTESGTAFSQVTLDISGLATDAVTAIQAGDLRVLVTETLPDGTTNTAVTDLHVSSTNTIIAKFAFGAAELGLQQSGITIELRALDSSFDISTALVRATFP